MIFNLWSQNHKQPKKNAIKLIYHLTCVFKCLRKIIVLRMSIMVCWCFTERQTKCTPDTRQCISYVIIRVGSTCQKLWSDMVSINAVWISYVIIVVVGVSTIWHCSIIVFVFVQRDEISMQVISSVELICGKVSLLKMKIKSKDIFWFEFLIFSKANNSISKNIK